MDVSLDEFEALAEAAYDALPSKMLASVANVGIIVQDQPLGELPRLFGLYTGRPLTTRSQYGFGELPDRITLFRNNIAAYSGTLPELKHRIAVTLVHEIGHYFGLDDARLHELGWD